MNDDLDMSNTRAICLVVAVVVTIALGGVACLVPDVAIPRGVLLLFAAFMLSRVFVWFIRYHELPEWSLYAACSLPIALEIAAAIYKDAFLAAYSGIGTLVAVIPMIAGAPLRRRLHLF